MSTHTISTTELSRSLSNILNKVHYQGESYQIKRGKEIIAKIIPDATKKSILKVTDLNKVLKSLPHLDSKDQQAFEKDIEKIRIKMKQKEKPWD